MFEKALVAKSGKRIPVEIHARLFQLNGQPTALSIARDLTRRKRAEQALRESEERFRKAFNTELVAMAISRRRDGMFLEVNPGFLKMSGYADDEIVGRTSPALNFFSPSHRQTLTATMEEQGCLYNQEMTVPTKRGEWRTILFSICPLTINNEDCLLTTLVDITDRKQAETALWESRNRYHTLFESVPVLIWEEDFSEMRDYFDKLRNSGVQDFRAYFEAHPEAVKACAGRVKILAVNEENVRFFGLEDKEELPETLPYCFTDQSWEVFKEEVIALAEGQTRFESEIPLQLPNGEEKMVLLKLNVVPGFEESLARVLISGSDITERKRAEEALLKSQTLLAEAERLAQLGAWEWDIPTGTFTCSEQWQRIHGVEQATFLFEELLPIAHPEDRERIQAALQDALDKDKPYEIEHRIIRQDTGQERVVQAYGKVIRNGAGQAVKMYGTGQDITARKRDEEKLRHSTERLQILRQIDRAILAAESPEVIAQVALGHLHRLIPYTQASVVELDLVADTGRLFVVDQSKATTPSSGPYPLKQVKPIIDRLKQGGVHLVQDMADLAEPSPLEQRLRASGLRSYLSLPLFIQKELIGSLNLASDKPGFFSLEQVEIVDEIATSLAIAIQQARLYEQARRDAAAKAMLLQEVNHRVGNNLLAILGILSLEKQRARQEETIPFSVLEDIYARIDSMGAVHRMLSASDWQSLNLANLVTQIIEAALSGSPIQDRIEVTVIAPESERIPITPKEGTILALIINELTTNSIKHAFQGRETGHLQVQISVAAGPAEEPDRPQVQLRFRDDGPGWSAAVLTGKHQNIGLKLVRLNVTEALNGQLTLINENGAVALIVFQPRLC